LRRRVSRDVVTAVEGEDFGDADRFGGSLLCVPAMF
jgi:hypothetical protein